MLRITLLLIACCMPAHASLEDEVERVASTRPALAHGPDSSFLAMTDAAPAREVGSKRKKDWRVGLTPYVWFTGFGVETGGERISSEFSDVVGLTNSGIMIIGTVEWKRWSFAADYTFADLGNDSTINRVQTSFGFKQHILHLTLGYAVLDQGSMHNPTGVRLRVAAGARYWDTNAKFKIVIPPLLPSGEETRIDIDEGTSWWDMTVGFNARWVLNPKVDFRLWGNIGGFGIGSSSDYTWEGGFVTSFLVTRWFGFHVGYRMMQYKRESGGIDMKMTMQGPIIGFTFVF